MELPPRSAFPATWLNLVSMLRLPPESVGEAKGKTSWSRGKDTKFNPMPLLLHAPHYLHGCWPQREAVLPPTHPPCFTVGAACFCPDKTAPDVHQSGFSAWVSAYIASGLYLRQSGL
ncbi:hypothetical protein AAFF_G00431190 [Aldrovandia affinis]|uniref:Uncharacterized protein n=1 Tax=Aldrovandia affinis TaxID=143900 RepID=A0AAD7S8M6_9TELE|nr:hypothetical protein AAFF_G00431190 [Aldrovandia affinis]